MVRLLSAGYLCLVLATGLLVQIVVQIKLVGWLPDFPAYDAFALATGLFALIVAPSALIAFHRVRVQSAAVMCGVLFAALTLLHAGLAAKSSSLAVQQWRDIVLWPTLITGLAACLLLVRLRPALVLTIVWMLGEAFVAIFAAWYAPSFGEATNFATYRYILFQVLLTTAVVTAAWLTTPADQAAFTPLAWLTTLSVATCLTVIALILSPWPIGSVLLALLLLRFVLTCLLTYPLFQEEKTDKEDSLSVC